MEKIFKFFVLTTLTSQLFAFAGFGLNVTTTDGAPQLFEVFFSSLIK